MGKTSEMFISNALTLSVSVRLEVRHCQAVQGGCRADHSNLFLLCYFPRYARLGSHRIFGNIPRFVPDTDGPGAGPLSLRPSRLSPPPDPSRGETFSAPLHQVTDSGQDLSCASPVQPVLFWQPGHCGCQYGCIVSWYSPISSRSHSTFSSNTLRLTTSSHQPRDGHKEPFHCLHIPLGPTGLFCITEIFCEKPNMEPRTEPVIRISNKIITLVRFIIIQRSPFLTGPSAETIYMEMTS